MIYQIEDYKIFSNNKYNEIYYKHLDANPSITDLLIDQEILDFLEKFSIDFSKPRIFYQYGEKLYRGSYVFKGKMIEGKKAFQQIKNKDIEEYVFVGKTFQLNDNFSYFFDEVDESFLTLEFSIEI